MSKFMDKIKETARADKKTIVLAEGEERRTIDAAAQILKEGYANIILLGNESKIKSMADGLDISVLAVVPDETPYRGILQLVHGMSEYKERYLPFMEYMAKKGYVCVIHDHRGHGKSVRALDDLGYMYGGGADAILKLSLIHI